MQVYLKDWKSPEEFFFVKKNVLYYFIYYYNSFFWCAFTSVQTESLLLSKIDINAFYSIFFKFKIEERAVAHYTSLSHTGK